MDELLYNVVMINARVIAFEADEVAEEDGTYKFYLDEELIAEFEKKNIAGYFVAEIDDEDA